MCSGKPVSSGIDIHIPARSREESAVDAELQPQEAGQPNDAPETRSSPLQAPAEKSKFGICVLVAAVLSLCMNAVLFKCLKGINPIIKIAWRTQMVVLTFPPLAIYDWLRADAETRAFLRRRDTWLKVFASCVVFNVAFGCWNLSVDTTSFAHATLYTNLSACVIVAARWLLVLAAALGVSVTAARPTCRETGGVLIAAGGLLASLLLDQQAADKDVITPPTILGDSIALLGSVFFALFFTMQKVWCSRVPTMIYQLALQSIGALMSILVCLCFDMPTSTPAATGILDWWHARQGWVVAGIWLLSVVGHVFLTTAVKHVSPVVVTVASSMQPAIAPFLGAAMGAASLPTKWTYIGGAILLLGVLVVVWPSKRKPPPVAGKQGVLQYNQMLDEVEEGMHKLNQTKRPDQEREMKGSTTKAPEEPIHV